MLNSDIILNKLVSFQEHARSAIVREIPVRFVLEDIKSNIYKNKVHKIQNLLASNEQEEGKRLKNLLPAVTFCGTFNKKRQRGEIKIYNQLIVLDMPCSTNKCNILI